MAKAVVVVVDADDVAEAGVVGVDVVVDGVVLEKNRQNTLPQCRKS